MFQRAFAWSVLLLLLAVGFFLAAGFSVTVANKVQPRRDRCLILNTGCWTELAWAYNGDNPAHSVVADTACSFGNMMNFTWCNEHPGHQQPIFANFGHVGFGAGLATIYAAAVQPGVRVLVFTHSSEGWRTPPKALETVPSAIAALECIREDCPDLQEDVATYLSYLCGTDEYRQARNQFGDQFAQQIQTAKKDLRQDRLTGHNGRIGRPGLRSLTQAGAESVSYLEDLAFGAASLAPRAGYAMNEERTIRDRILALLDCCAELYTAPFNDKPLRRLINPARFWTDVGGEEAWCAWANIVAAICRARGVRFVFYIPPHLHVSEEEYRGFKTDFVDPVRDTFAHDPNVTVIDRALCRDGKLNQYDLIWLGQRRIPYKEGYFGNVIGRLKMARILVSALLAEGILEGKDGPVDYRGSAWPGEAALPAVFQELQLVDSPHDGTTRAAKP